MLMRRAGHNVDKEVNLPFVHRKKKGIRQQIAQVRRTDIRDRTHFGHEIHYDIGVTLPTAANKDTKKLKAADRYWKSKHSNYVRFQADYESENPLNS